MTRKIPAIVAAVGATLALTAPAQAATAQTAAKQCSRAATVTSGTVQSLTGNTVSPDAQHKLNGFSLYTTTTAAKVSYQKVTYTFKSGAIFGLSCFGHSQAEGARYPLISLRMGKVTAKFRKGKPGAVSSPEGLWDPYQSKAMTMTVIRTPKGNPTIDEVLADGPDSIFLGTVKVHKTKGRGYLNITPYVGRKPGVCRQGKGGTFIAKRFSGGRMKGTSKFVSLAPFSPR